MLWISVSQLISDILQFITGLSTAIVDFLLSYAGIVAIIVGLISIYRFVILRPNVRLVADESELAGRIKDGAYKSGISFNLVNVGQRFAEDVFVRVELSNWNFGRRPSGMVIQVTENPGTKNSRTYGKQPNKTNDGDETGISLQESVIERRKNQVTRLGGGEIYQLLIDDPVYSEAEFGLFYGRIFLERQREYEVEYEIGCRSYGPREGTITFKIGYDQIEVEHDHPGFLDSLIGNIRSTVKRVPHKARGFIDDHSGWNLRLEPIITDQWMESYGMIEGTVVKQPNENSTKQDGFLFGNNYAENLLPVARVKSRSQVTEPLKIKATATIWYDNLNEAEPLGAVTLSAYGIESDEVWVTRSPKRRSGAYTHLIDYNTEYSTPINQPLPIPPLKVNGEKVKFGDLRTEWNTEYYPIEKRDIVGVSVDLELGQLDDEYTITASNSNQTLRSFFVVAKMYNGKQEVIATPIRRFELDPGTTQEQTVRLEINHTDESVVKAEPIVLGGL